MTERNENSELDSFKENYSNGLEGFFELLEMDNTPIPPDPLSMGVDERTLEELSDDEKTAVKTILFERLGISEEDPKQNEVRKYKSQASSDSKSPGWINITVYKTNSEDLFLQELVFQDGQTRWVVGADLDI